MLIILYNSKSLSVFYGTISILDHAFFVRDGGGGGRILKQQPRQYLENPFQRIQNVKPVAARLLSHRRASFAQRKLTCNRQSEILRQLPVGFFDDALESRFLAAAATAATAAPDEAERDGGEGEEDDDDVENDDDFDEFRQTGQLALQRRGTFVVENRVSVTFRDAALMHGAVGFTGGAVRNVIVVDAVGSDADSRGTGAGARRHRCT